MKFSSIRGYFEKLHNVLYVVILTPMLLFGYLYLQRQAPANKEVETVRFPELSLILALLFGIVIAVSFGWFSSNLRSCRQFNALNDKLKCYASATRIRFLLIAGATVILTVGYYLTHDKLFVALFGINLILFSWWWPTPRKVSRDLHLKGEEHQKVLLKRDS